jgi:hypothetical protein
MERKIWNNTWTITTAIRDIPQLSVNANALHIAGIAVKNVNIAQIASVRNVQKEGQDK